jgi:hypothetical protein
MSFHAEYLGLLFLTPFVLLVASAIVIACQRSSYGHEFEAKKDMTRTYRVPFLQSFICCPTRADTRKRIDRSTRANIKANESTSGAKRRFDSAVIALEAMRYALYTEHTHAYDVSVANDSAVVPRPPPPPPRVSAV